MKNIVDLEILVVGSLEKQFSDEAREETRNRLLKYFNSPEKYLNEPKLREVFIFEHKNVYYHFMIITVEIPGENEIKIKVLLTDITSLESNLIQT